MLLRNRLALFINTDLWHRDPVTLHSTKSRVGRTICQLGAARNYFEPRWLWEMGPYDRNALRGQGRRRAAGEHRVTTRSVLSSKFLCLSWEFMPRKACHHKLTLKAEFLLGWTVIPRSSGNREAPNQSSNIRLARDPSRIDASCGDPFLQADL